MLSNLTRETPRQLLLALGALIFAVYAEYSGLDMWFAHLFYDPVHNNWPLRSLFVTKTVLHDYAQGTVKILVIVMILLLVASHSVQHLRPYRRLITYLLLATVSGPIVVSLLKNLTHIQSPWQLVEFGGKMTYIRIFDPLVHDIPAGRAFPGGHSSGGFAFLSLYFLFNEYAPRYRRYGFIIPLINGIVFALNQEIRGAHFISHDLVSLAICWVSAVFWSRVFLHKPIEPRRLKCNY